eukprot:TRINITY_DN10913_c0_g1_i1.p1 TRINITY_DN10913_c0_g1~~TRINITY_DN10913_c0_g1_i1.p1  ORF type:complete len:107 (+),score=11.29 TRINITY_DN10913_c0_g1_i1:31-321(+)
MTLFTLDDLCGPAQVSIRQVNEYDYEVTVDIRDGRRLEGHARAVPVTDMAANAIDLNFLPGYRIRMVRGDVRGHSGTLMFARGEGRDWENLGACVF